MKFDDLTKIDDQVIRRRVKKILTVGIKLNETENKLLSDLRGNMTDIYNLNKICPWNPTTRQPDCTNGQTWALDPDMSDRMAQSQDYDELKYFILIFNH